MDPPATSGWGTPEKPKRHYAPRGTGGTFGGKRPPKKVHARADFEKRRDAHQWSLQAKKDLQAKRTDPRKWTPRPTQIVPTTSS